MKTITEKLKYWRGELAGNKFRLQDVLVNQFIQHLEELQKEDIVSKDDKWVKELEKLPALDENNNPIKEDTVTPLQEEEIEKLAKSMYQFQDGPDHSWDAMQNQRRQGFVDGYKAALSAPKEDTNINPLK